VPPKAKNSEV